VALDLDDLVGQSLLLRPHGPRVMPDLLEAMARVRPAGIVLFGDNVESPPQLHAFIRKLKTHAAALSLPPLIVAIDQEGGIVSRLSPPFTIVPSAMAQGETGDPAVATACARITGEQLRAMGINVNFAPVLDVNINPRNPVIATRAFGDDPALVTEFGLAALAGYEATGIIATAKHFPGHGDTAIDSHLGLPVVTHRRERLDAVEFAPFRAAIAAGIPAIMSAHIVYIAFDDRPATLSRPILSDLLRGEFGFDGVIFTDALDMQAVAKRYGQAGAARRAKAAGVDIALPVGPLTEQIAVFDTLRQAAAAGEIPEAAFTATIERLARLRQRYDLSHEVPPFTPLAAQLDTVAFEIARRGIRVTERQPRLPIGAATRIALIDCVQPRWTLAEEATARAELLRGLIERAFPRATCVAVGPQPTPADIAVAGAAASQSELTLFVTRDAFRYEHQVALGRMLAALDRPLIHVAARAPYDEAYLPDVAATLLTFGDPPVSLQALVAILGG